jgi:hypothetical protein
MSPDVCPKCRRQARETDQACARCGLLRTHFATYDPRPPPHPRLDPLWAHALADWEDARRHQALFDVVQSDVIGMEALAGLSQRYSAVLRERPDDQIAAAAQERLLQLALRLPSPADRERGDLWVKVVRGAFGVILIVIALWLLRAILPR